MRKTFYILFFFFTGLFFFVINASGQQINQTRISLQLQNVSLRQALREIEAKTPFKFLAKAEDIEVGGTISINVQNELLNKILDDLFRGRNLEYRQDGVNVFIKRNNEGAVRTSSATPGKKYSVHGTVKSARTGEVLIGATVMVAGNDAATVTNNYGFYSLTLAGGNYS
jgi:hypothetical protein